MDYLFCNNGPEMARHQWECLVQSHEWCLAQQRPHTWLSTYVGPRVLRVHSQLWDSPVLEQWSSAIATPTLRVAHMGLAGPHDMGTEFIVQELSKSQKVWPTHARAQEGRIKAAVRGDGSGPECTTHYTQHALRHTALPFCITRMQGILAIAIW